MTDLVKTKKQRAQRSKPAKEKTVGDKNRGRNCRGQSNQHEGQQKKNAYSKVSQFLTKNLRKIGVAVFFLGLLVVVFVGSTIGFTKCEPGFRNVRMYSTVVTPNKATEIFRENGSNKAILPCFFESCPFSASLSSDSGIQNLDQISHYCVGDRP